jgi:hypothetical protein
MVIFCQSSNLLFCCCGIEKTAQLVTFQMKLVPSTDIALATLVDMIWSIVFRIPGRFSMRKLEVLCLDSDRLV